MVGKWGVSADKLTYTFELREGLRFSDGSPVTADDVVASIRRWVARDGAGQQIMDRAKDISKKNDATFVIALKERYGLLIDMMAKTGTPILFIMRRKEAETDPYQQITEYIGSGPFIFNREETRHGVRYVYDKSPTYVPRREPASGIAGGKVVKLDRVVFENIGDAQTAMAALQAGEIDFYESPPIDLLDQFESDHNLKVQVLNKTGNVGWLRMNCLHPPFDKVEARQAMLHLVDQEEYMKAAFGHPKYYRKCASNFGCGTPMENDEHTDWFRTAPDPAKAKELFQKAGYDGHPVVILHATNLDFVDNAAHITAQRLRQIGVNAQLATSDWGGVVTRRASKSAPDQGGWNIFITWAIAATLSNPLGLAHAANGEKGWFGWPSNERHERLREEWANAGSLDEQKAIAREMQRNAWDFVPHVWLGQWVAPVAYRSNLRGMLSIPIVIPFWNVEKLE
jgi:peptide/nickel transport system substrate-binding protein